MRVYSTTAVVQVDDDENKIFFAVVAVVCTMCRRMDIEQRSSERAVGCVRSRVPGYHTVLIFERTFDVRAPQTLVFYIWPNILKKKKRTRAGRPLQINKVSAIIIIDRTLYSWYM